MLEPTSVPKFLIVCQPPVLTHIGGAAHFLLRDGLIVDWETGGEGRRDILE